MTDPLRLAATVVELGMARYVRGEPRWTAASIALVVVSIVCAVTAGGFAIAALLIYLIPLIGAASAALVVAVALVAVSSITAGAGQFLSRPSRKHGVSLPPDLESLVADAEGFVRDHKALMLSAAFVAGILGSDGASRRRLD
jgi:hypothetical protein